MDANAATEQPSSSSSSSSSRASTVSDIAKDIFLWRRKSLSLAVVLMSTATWLLLEFYQFNFVTVASWVAMAIVTLLLLWGNILKLFGKEPPDLSGLEISEQAALDVANSIREVAEETVRWMFHVSAERERFVFAQVVAGLLLLSYVGTFSDLLTLLYIGTVLGMTVPVIYDKYEEKIKRCGEWVRVKLSQLYEKVDEKVIKKMKNKVVVMEVKEKKIE